MLGRSESGTIARVDLRSRSSAILSYSGTASFSVDVLGLWLGPSERLIEGVDGLREL